MDDKCDKLCKNERDTLKMLIEDGRFKRLKEMFQNCKPMEGEWKEWKVEDNDEQKS